MDLSTEKKRKSLKYKSKLLDKSDKEKLIAFESEPPLPTEDPITPENPKKLNRSKSWLSKSNSVMSSLSSITSPTSPALPTSPPPPETKPSVTLQQQFSLRSVTAKTKRSSKRLSHGKQKSIEIFSYDPIMASEAHPPPPQITTSSTGGTNSNEGTPKKHPTRFKQSLERTGSSKTDVMALSFHPGTLSESVLPPVINRKVVHPEVVLEEETTNFQQKSYKLSYVEDIYSSNFLPFKHSNWVCTYEHTPDDYSIISILEKSVPNRGYKVLENSKSGFKSMYIAEDSIQTGPMNSFTLSAEKHLKMFYKTPHIYKLKQTATTELAAIEYKHRQEVKKMQIAILFAKRGQSDPMDMFENTEPSENFSRFLRVMGLPFEKPGEDGISHHIHVSIWKLIKVEWYVAPHMNHEEHRRLIGNSQCVLFFYDNPEEDEPFETKLFSNLGMVPQFFIVIKPHLNSGKYRVGFFMRNTMQHFGPQLPANYLFESISLKDYILTKVHNGYIMAQRTGKISQMYQRPRGDTIMEIVKKYASKAYKVHHQDATTDDD